MHKYRVTYEHPANIHHVTLIIDKQNQICNELASTIQELATGGSRISEAQALMLL